MEENIVRIGGLKPLNGRMMGGVFSIRTAPPKWRIHHGAPGFAAVKGKAERPRLARKKCADLRLFSLSRALSRINGGDPDSGRARGAAVSAKEARRAR